MNGKKKIYLETTIPSYLAARPSRDVVVLAHQQITKEWWEESKNNYDIFISQVVIEEVKAGDPTVAEARLLLIKEFTILDLTNEIEDLAFEYMRFLQFPERCLRDAYHLSFSVGSKMDYLLTWNCAHLANEMIRKKLREINGKRGYGTPAICTPEELIAH